MVRAVDEKNCCGLRRLTAPAKLPVVARDAKLETRNRRETNAPDYCFPPILSLECDQTRLAAEDWPSRRENGVASPSAFTPCIPFTKSAS